MGVEEVGGLGIGESISLKLRESVTDRGVLSAVPLLHLVQFSRPTQFSSVILYLTRDSASYNSQYTEQHLYLVLLLVVAVMFSMIFPIDTLRMLRNQLSSSGA